MKKLLGLVVALLVLTLASCGGGGGGGSSGPAQPTTVSGLVLAPGGQIAFDRQPAPLTRLAEALLPNAAAGVTGLVPVADGTAVELVRIDANGSVVASLAQTTTSAGRYSLDLSALNAGYAPDLIVRVRNANGGAQMRAFVAGGTSDLNPVSEAAVRIALEEIAKQPSVSLANFSPQELGDIAGTIDLLATHKKLAAGADVEASVQAIRAMVLADSAAQSYIRDAAGVGVSTSGPGDIGNYFRSEPNLSYTYNVNANFGQIRQYQTFRQTSGPRVAGGNVMVFTEAGGEDYYTEDASGVTFFGGSDALDGAVAPFVELKFPLRVGNSFLQIDKKNLLLDVDFDGRDDSVDIRSEASVLDFEPLSVPIGSQSNCAKIQEDVTVTYRTSNNGKVNVVGKNTYWLCPGIGLTKQIIELTENGGGTRRETRELTAFVDSNVPPNPNPQPNPNPNPQPNPTPAVTTRSITLASNDLVFDPFSQRLLASIPGRVGGNGNSIAFIEPLAGVVEQTIAIGSEPTKLALSDNGQYLYTALDGAGAVRRLDLTTKTAGAQFSLDINAPFGQLYARDIAVMPGNPKTIAISLFQRSWDRSFLSGVWLPLVVATIDSSYALHVATELKMPSAEVWLLVPLGVFAVALTHRFARLANRYRSMLRLDNFARELGRETATGNFDSRLLARVADVMHAEQAWLCRPADGSRTLLSSQGGVTVAGVTPFDRAAAAIAVRLEAATTAGDAADGEELEDDRLRLIFTCCHPALTPDAQVALTLREVCGLTTEEIAHAFLTRASTVAQRIVRAKAKIRDAAIPYQVPGLSDLPDRLDAVLQVIYLVFNEGYAASSGAALTRGDLSAEAIRLGRLLVDLLPEPDAQGAG